MVVLILTVVGAVAFVAGVFVVGFQVGVRESQSELHRTWFETAQAQRRLHDLTRDAFVAMAEHAERRGDL